MTDYITKRREIHIAWIIFSENMSFQNTDR